MYGIFTYIGVVSRVNVGINIYHTWSFLGLGGMDLMETLLQTGPMEEEPAANILWPIAIRRALCTEIPGRKCSNEQ